MKDASPTSAQAPALPWLALGAVAGLMAAGYGLLERSGPAGTLPADAVASVNGTIIDNARLDRAAAQLEATYGQPIDQEQRTRVLEQLIEEELLVQRGIELGMAESEATVRAAIVQSLVASVTAETDAADPDDATLQAYLEDNADRYTYASAMKIDAWTSDDERAARSFLARLQQGADAVAPDGLAAVPGLPRGPAPLERLRMFVGPAIAAAAADMPVGASAVFARQGRWYVVRVSRRDSGTLADLATVRSQVLIDYRRSLADERLQEYLEGLRDMAEVRVAMPR
jgi:parvulin-like peptidyl-prolyl isomerase